MAEEHSAVSRIYDRRADELSLDVAIHRALTRRELADVFDRRIDFVHYIGHCNDRGLACADGELPADSLDDCAAPTFFLNACGSFVEGLALIRKGAIGGVVTRNRVLDRDATRIGIEFARLIMYGFSLEQALAIASKRSLTSYEYAVVGDGGYRLSQSDDPDPVCLSVATMEDGRFEVTTEITPIRDIGRCYQSYLAEDGRLRLTGNPERFEIDRRSLVDFLEGVNQPVIFEGAYYWSDDLYIKLRD